MRVAAIVVTYNRQELLKKTLAALDAQTRIPEVVIVIDNASTDDTWQMLKGWKPRRMTMDIHRLPRNDGGAGGFYVGMDLAYEAGYDAFWIMDDDTVPRPDALAQLVDAYEEAAAYQSRPPSFVSSMVVWTDGEACRMNYPKAKWDWISPLAHGKRWVNLECASFVSCMVMRHAVEKVGLPYPEYFIWFDDAEYTYRLAKWSTGIFVPDSVVDHLMPKNDAVSWGQVTEDNFWKFSRGIRNQVSAAMSLRRLDILATAFQSMVGQMLTTPAPVPLRAKLSWAAVSGLWFRPRVRFPRAMGEVTFDRHALKEDPTDLDVTH
ncbi:glycosyltransferase family 2 protein [Schaalia sp. 19OD2882]|uniref:glycosyltransferase family 2 protein n=1 Tax=Schaalia sp. 19OD2882 TaxID=2794089 RepID=UPI001C1ED8DB|nr:glycosyltransferase family 2 protein [Schaalia sp. 19OD2882]QWW20288.1 glycosyltransferase family 2 protein [Schaalia sp. 19OD2882]